MELSKAILRIFEVRATPGNAGILKQKLSDTSVAVVAGKPGNLGFFFGENISKNDNDLVFISVWQDLESIQSMFGEDWQEAFLPEGYAEIIESCSIRHVQIDGKLVTANS